MKKRVIVFFVVCIAAVMSVTAQTAESYNTAGIEKAEKGLYKEALDDFSKAIEINPQYAEAYFNRAMMYGQQGKITLSCADLQKAKELGLKQAASMIEKHSK